MPYRFNFHTKKSDYYERSVDVTTAGLVLAMNFNPETLLGLAGSEKVLDSSGYNNHGQNHGATAVSTGGFNNGGFLSFDGINDYVRVFRNTNLNVTNYFSIAFWIKTTNTDYRFPLCKWRDSNGWCFDTLGGALRYWQAGGVAAISIPNGEYNDGNWHYVVVTVNATTNNAKIYLDGVLKQEATHSDYSNTTTTDYLYIGKYTTYSHYWPGSLDEIRIYSQVLLTPDEVKQLYLQKKEIYNSFVSQKNVYVDEIGDVDVKGFVLHNGRRAHVSTQFDKTADTTLTNIPGLSAELITGRKYKFTVNLFVNADATGGHKYAMSGTATITNIIYQINSISNTTNLNVINSRQTALGGSAGQAGATIIHTVIEGFINLGDGGTLTCQFAQNVANGTSSVLIGSNMIVEQIS